MPKNGMGWDVMGIVCVCVCVCHYKFQVWATILGLPIMSLTH